MSTLVLTLAACGKTPTEPSGDLIVQPQCSNPASLFGAENRRYPDRYIDEYAVAFKFGTDANTEALRLARKYHFRITNMYTVPGFLASLTPTTVAALRCEPSVQNVQFAHSLTPLP